MVDTKSLLKGVGVVIVALVVIRLALWLLGIVVGVVLWGLQLALSLLFLGLLLYGLYWGYTTFVSDSKGSAREREKVFER